MKNSKNKNSKDNWAEQSGPNKKRGEAAKEAQTGGNTENVSAEKNVRHQRWYDKDPVLKEALELLKLSAPDERKEAQEYILKLQEEVAADVIERIYEMVTQYSGKGNRWYDNDPVMLRAVEILRHADPKTQRIAALKILQSLEQKKDNE